MTSFHRRQLARGAALVLLVGLVYLPVLRAGWVWDDDSCVTNNRSLRSLEGLRRIWLEPTSRVVLPQYYPLTSTTFWVEHHLWGLHAAGYHVVNVLLHGSSAVLLWQLLVCLGVPGAWIAAAIWAVHPVMAESVAWISERKNVLSGVLYLAAALAYTRFDAPFGGSHARPEGTRRWGWYGAALAFFLCALWSKTVTSTLPAALLLAVWWKRGRVRASDVVPLLPFVLVGAVMGASTAWMERHLVGARGDEWKFTPADRLLIAGRAVWFYAAKLAWPVGLAFNYERWAIDPGRLSAWAFPIAAAAVVALLLVTRQRIGRGPVTGALFFIGTLAPALGLFDVYPMRYSFVADHFQYLASIGLLALVAAAGASIPGARAMRTAAAALAIGVLAALTYVRALVFENSETLWRDTLTKNPSSWLAHTSLMKHYSALGDTDKTVAEAAAAMALRPDDAEVRSWLALSLAAAGRKDEARREHERAVDSADAVARYNYGWDLERWGETEAAERQYRAALAIDPSTPWVRTHLGRLLTDRGDQAGAIALYREELTVSPDSPSAVENLASALLKADQLPEAEGLLRDLLHVDPENARARNTLAIALMQRRDTAAAERELRRALRDAPSLAEAHNTLGAVLAVEGNLEEAIAEYREALRLRPDYARARSNLAAALAQKDDKAGDGG